MVYPNNNGYGPTTERDSVEEDITEYPHQAAIELRDSSR